MYRKVTLENGLRIVMQRLPHVRSLSVGFWAGAGVHCEEAANNGISHVIEHMLFKGTLRRNARQIAETLESVGGQLDAYTEKEFTTVQARVLDEDMELAVDLLSDMITGSVFDAGELAREKGVIAEEIRMYEDLPESLIHDELAALVLKGDKMALPILGRMQVIDGLDRDSLLDFRSAFYTPDNIVVAVSGNFDESALTDALESGLGSLAGRLPHIDQPLPECGRYVSINQRQTEQAHILLGGPAVSITSPERYPLSVLDRILGGSMSSRLFQEVREKRGLAYAVYSYHSLFSRNGLFGIYAGTAPETTLQVTELLLGEIERISRKGITQTELHSAVAQIKGALYLGLESTSAVMRRLAKAELYLNRRLPPEEIMAAAEAVTPDDVVELAGRLFDPDRLSLAVIGPLSDADTEALQRMWRRPGQ